MILKSQRIYLRPLQEEDAQSFLENTRDEEIRYMTGTKTYTLEQIKQHIRNCKNNSTRYDFAMFK